MLNDAVNELGWASLKPVRKIDTILCTKFLLLRNFVPQKERLIISMLILFSQFKVRLKLYNHHYDLQKLDRITVIYCSRTCASMRTVFQFAKTKVLSFSGFLVVFQALFTLP